MASLASMFGLWILGGLLLTTTTVISCEIESPRQSLTSTACHAKKTEQNRSWHPMVTTGSQDPAAHGKIKFGWERAQWFAIPRGGSLSSVQYKEQCKVDVLFLLKMLMWNMTHSIDLMD